MARRPDRVLTDPTVIRALAHPARLTVLEALDDGAELTATACAAEAGISPSAMSYHLRALEKYGFVERVEGSGDGRERPWRAVNPGFRIESMPDAEAVNAAGALTAVTFDRVLQEVERWHAVRGGEPEQWRAVSAVHSAHAWLTVDEAQQLTELVQTFVDERSGRTAKEHPQDARRMRLLRVLVPVGGTGSDR